MNLCGQKLADALRDGKSERQIAKLLGLTRKMIWRAKLVASIPEELYERLRATKPRLSSKEMELVARHLRGDDFTGEVEHCPHCGEALRHRGLKPSTVRVVEEWEARHPD
jgi:transposase